MKRTVTEMFSLDGKVAVVTGGNQGIGKGIARGLAGAGASIVIADITIPIADGGQMAETPAEINRDFGVTALGMRVDVRQEGENESMVKKTLDAFGHIDILVCNAGIGGGGTLPQDTTLEKWNDVLNTNVRSLFLAAKSAYPAMVREGGGKIISIGSILSIFGIGTSSCYAASKGGVLQLTRSLAAAWGKDNIQVNCILPGWIDTDLMITVRKMNPAINDRVIARTPAGRLGDPLDLAGTAVFLASSASDFVTGAAIPVDGGYLIQG